MYIFYKFLKAAFILLALFIFTGNTFGQTCDAAPKQVLIDLNPLNPNDLPAIAAQYGLNPTPLDQVGTPPTYRMRILDSTAQNPCQLATTLLGDARILRGRTESQDELCRGI